MVYRVEHYSKIAELIINDPTITDENICHELEVTFHRKFSRSAIQQIRNSQEAMAMVGLKPLTFKVASNRGSNAQSPENKEKKKCLISGTSIDKSLLMRPIGSLFVDSIMVSRRRER